MSEFCTMEQAIECVKNGGRAELKGTAESAWTKIRRTKTGRVRYRYTSGNYCYSGDFYRNWNYRITRPAPEKTYTTAEAITEVIATGGEMVSDDATYELWRDDDGDIRCHSSVIHDDLMYIPCSVTWRKKPYESKKSISGEESGYSPGLDKIHDAIGQIAGNVKVTWTVESVD